MKEYEDAEIRMIQQSIQSINGLKDKMSADLQREFDFIVDTLGKRLPRPVVKRDICFECPSCGYEVFAALTDVFCFYCHECGQLIYHNAEG